MGQSTIQLPLAHLLLGREDELTIRVVVELVLLLPSLGADLEHLLFEGLRLQHLAPLSLQQRPYGLDWVEL